MILVLASLNDRPARALVRRWGAHGAKLLTCRDLSTSGWRYHPGDPAASCAVVGNRRVAFDQIDGVLVRMPSVVESDLPHIVAADRDYVAAEMNAFLVAWLSEARCPVVNRPTPTCLTGPNWHREQWLHAAAQAGARLRSTPGLASPGAAGPGLDAERLCTVTVVGGDCFGQADESLKGASRRLARAAGVTLLAVQFGGPDADAEFIGAYPGGDVSQPGVADALLDCLCRHAATV